jgi:2-C-methyl-D-erythritol 2,4-cyclodiphosphate synthase
MLRVAMNRVAALGFRVNQIDVAIIAERPRIAPHRDAMRANLAASLAIEPSAVSIKGKTNEGMGWIGREEGLACIAVATVVPSGG